MSDSVTVGKFTLPRAEAEDLEVWMRGHGGADWGVAHGALIRALHEIPPPTPPKLAATCGEVLERANALRMLALL